MPCIPKHRPRNRDRLRPVTQGVALGWLVCGPLAHPERRRAKCMTRSRLMARVAIDDQEDLFPAAPAKVPEELDKPGGLEQPGVSRAPKAAARTARTPRADLLPLAGGRDHRSLAAQPIGAAQRRLRTEARLIEKEDRCIHGARPPAQPRVILPDPLGDRLGIAFAGPAQGLLRGAFQARQQPAHRRPAPHLALLWGGKLALRAGGFAGAQPRLAFADRPPQPRVDARAAKTERTHDFAGGLAIFPHRAFSSR